MFLPARLNYGPTLKLWRCPDDECDCNGARFSIESMDVTRNPMHVTHWESDVCVDPEQEDWARLKAEARAAVKAFEGFVDVSVLGPIVLKARPFILTRRKSRRRVLPFAPRLVEHLAAKQSRP